MITCDAIKIAYRQSRDGFVVSFVLHPNEVPPELANAHIGSQWQLKLVELDDDGNPSETAEKGTASRPSPSPDKRLVQRAAMLCQDGAFQAYLVTHSMLDHRSDNRDRDAATALRLICGVDTRKDIIPGSPAAEKFRELVEKFEAWKLEPTVGA